MKDFIIDQVGWHTQLTGNTESLSKIHQRFNNISIFLQNEGLTTRNLIETDEKLNDDFCIKVSDLTDDGFLLMKKCYDKWLRYLDRGGSPDNLKIFEKILFKVRDKSTFSDENNKPCT